VTAVPMYAALDIGSVALKAVMAPRDGSALGRVHRRIRGRLRPCLTAVLEELADLASGHDCRLVAVTGARAGSYAAVLGVREISPIVAAFHGVRLVAPTAGAALELGGEHASFLRFSQPTATGDRSLQSFTVNGACSAGTGAFLEQESHRFGISIDELGRRALESRRTMRIAGRCAVFAKTDLVHKHQNGIPMEDLAYALCLAMAHTVTGELIGREAFQRPVALVGGVAANPGMQRAVREALELSEDELLVPEQPAFVGALGAVDAFLRRGDGEGVPLPEALALAASASPPAAPRVQLPRLCGNGTWAAATPVPRATKPRDGGIVGVDIGSTSTNLAWVDPDGTVRATTSLPTQGDPLAAVCGVLRDLERREGVLAPRAVGVTGSGRRFVEEMIGADFAINEITAHAAGCVQYFPEADTIFDIGGQDSKFIRIENRAVTGFEMNKVCSAGTGSFLEEMSALLGLRIDGEFAREALRSETPIELGERCTVFMGSEIARHLQDGCAREDLAAGLAYAVVRNYLSRVVGRHPVGGRIVFQGGVAANTAVVAALHNVLRRDVTVHPFNDTAGAIGVALLAARHVTGASRFRGFGDLERSQVRTRSFSCHHCSNGCTVHVTRGPSRQRFFAGGLCDRYDAPTAEGSGLPRVDLFAERDAAIARWVHAVPPETDGAIGLPRALLFHEQLPFWAAFLDALGVPYALSPETTTGMVEHGAAIAHRGTCLPLTIAYGHVTALAAAGSGRILLPSVASLSDGTVAERLDHACPAVQGWPYTARALLDTGAELLIPRLRLGMPRLADRDLTVFAARLGATADAARVAIAEGREAERAFRNAMLRRGDEVLAQRRERPTAVVLARSYTVGDPQIRLRLTRVLHDVGLTGVPLDMVRDEARASAALHGMYWYYGKRLLQAARALRGLGDVAAISISSFGCGPDSFILHMLRRELGDVPLLELEVDEHSEFNGIHTRVEAFRWALGSKRRTLARSPAPPGRVGEQDLHARRLYVPRMSDHAEAFAAAFRSCGVDAEVLPQPDERSIALGRTAVDGTECLPCAFVIGDMLRQLERRDPGAPDPAFFMIAGDGPCRLGQYPWLQRVILDARGHADVPIFNASQDPEFYEKFGMVPAGFQRRAWGGTVATDLLFRKWRECRARALDRAEVDGVYRKQLAALARAVEERASLPRALRRGFDALDAQPRRNGPPPLRIGLLGENYVRCNAAANADLADGLEAMGVEVWYPSLCEWVLYTNWTARLHCRYEGLTRRLLMLHAIDALQRFDMTRLTDSVRGRLSNLGYPSVRRLLRFAAPYVPDTFEGETVVGIGRTIDLHRRGVSGVVHVSPFGCMVGRIVESIGRRVSDDLDGFPMLHLEYDGRQGEHLHGLLEGFVMQAAAWREQRNATTGAG
jgi:predicted CoA-substrate-specific enzyme activase